MAQAVIDFYLMSGTGELYQLIPPEPYVFGRDDDVDLVIKDNLTSRRHCELRWTDSEFWTMHDLESRNGVFANGVRIVGSRKLEDRDRVQVGGQQFTYYMLPPGSDTSALGKGEDGGISSVETFEVSAGAISRGGGPSFVGEIRQGALGELLRYFHITRKTGRLMLGNSLGQQLWLIEGVPRHAMSDAERGLPAVKALTERPPGPFAFFEKENPPSVTIEGDGPTILSELLGGTHLDDFGIDVHDIQKAQRLQRQMLARLPVIPGYDIAAFYEGRSGVSGDFYDVGTMGDGKLLMVVGDVAGHGIQAAIVVTSLLKTLRSLRKTHTDLIELLAKLNDDIREDLLSGQFVTLFAATLRPSTGEVEVILAGHHTGYLCSLAGRAPLPFGRRGMAIGLVATEMFRKSLQLTPVRLAKGDALVQFTDGILEATVGEQEEYGDERMQASVLRHSSMEDLQGFVNAIANDVKTIASRIDDDLTILALRRTAEVPSEARRKSSRIVRKTTERLGPPSAAGEALSANSASASEAAQLAAVAKKPGSDPYLGRSFGQVSLICRIGEGANGYVYRGHHAFLERDVAVKILLQRGDLADMQGRKRFLAEARLAAKVKHANVLQMLDGGTTDDGLTYIIMELVEGPTLARRLDEHGRIGHRELMTLAAQISDGVSAIHGLGILHRDLKPDNILVDPMGVAKIADLGMARMIDQDTMSKLTKTGTILGTPAYMSPEAVKGDGVGPEADVYSLGVTLYHLLAGRPPYDGATAYDIMMAHLEGKFTPLRDLAPDADRDFTALIERCLAADPAKRPHASAMARELSTAKSLAVQIERTNNQAAVPEFFRKKKPQGGRGRLPLLVGGGLVAVGVIVAIVVKVLG
jgi:tRNA A-37 threonylcarbamoyl transferase component Bud32